jgi:hypothetical protein
VNADSLAVDVGRGVLHHVRCASPEHKAAQFDRERIGGKRYGAHFRVSFSDATPAEVSELDTSRKPILRRLEWP